MTRHYFLVHGWLDPLDDFCDPGRARSPYNTEIEVKLPDVELAEKLIRHRLSVEQACMQEDRPNSGLARHPGDQRRDRHEGRARTEQD